MEDGQAIQCLKRGEIAGLEILVTRYQVKAVRAAFLITRDEPLAEDVVQDSFVRFFHSVRHFDESRPFEPYFMRCVINEALNAIKESHKWTQIEEETGFDGLQSLLIRGAPVEEQAEYNQLIGEIQSAMAKLSPRQRAVIVQRYYLELSEMEMAEALDIAPGTVKWLLNAARSRLHRLLGTERSAQ